MSKAMAQAAIDQDAHTDRALDGVLPSLRCPVSGQPLRREGSTLVSLDGRHRYTIADPGIPLFAVRPHLQASRIQQAHYDHIAPEYVRNLVLPHTRIYAAYLDEVLLDAIGADPPGFVGELCCGRGEAFHLLRTLAAGVPAGGIGLDISQAMLKAASGEFPREEFLFIQADATMLPLADEIFDTVFMLGGIHHVNDRDRLFAEIYRVLKPGGRFYFREPVNDFFLWRWLRSEVYRLSPTLDAETERPLRHHQTTAQLTRAGLEVIHWRTCGFLAYCIVMNSDVLLVNRLLMLLPGIRRITRAAARIDDWAVGLPFLRNAGLQVVGVARKPPATSSESPRIRSSRYRSIRPPIPAGVQRPHFGDASELEQPEISATGPSGA